MCERPQTTRPPLCSLHHPRTMGRWTAFLQVWVPIIPFLKVKDFLSSVVTCGIPGYVPHGQTVGFGHSFGDSVVTSCKPGFQLVGSRRRSCLGNGTWSGDRPRCQGRIFTPSLNLTFSPLQSWHVHWRPSLNMVVLLSQPDEAGNWPAAPQYQSMQMSNSPVPRVINWKALTKCVAWEMGDLVAIFQSANHFPVSCLLCGYFG